jgi:CheY-like chemotaxis protein
MALAHKKTACIIDDDRIYVSLVKKIIERKNLCSKLLIFNDGKQSITYFEALLDDLRIEDIPEVIFLDLNMPIMDGWEFIERFKKIKNKFNKDIELYVVSSSINPIDINRAKAFNEVNDYIKKPLNIKALEKIFRYDNAS